MTVSEQAPRPAFISWGSWRLLVLASLVCVVFSVFALWQGYRGANGLLLEPYQPFGGDFINLWTTARMTLEGRIGEIYRSEAFMAYQHGFLDENIGQRLWAYPPQSLFLAWPVGLAGYFLSFLLFSGFGFAVLIFGARRFGFSWMETLVLACSPAAMACLKLGQTGSIACGLLLIALSPRNAEARPLTVISATILTIKPQIGVLLPLVWLVQRRWLLIGATAAAVVLIAVSSTVVFGPQSWRDYIGDTLVALSDLEHNGTGPFLGMIPSLFIALRLVGLDGDTASLVHLVFAALMVPVLVWRLVGAHGAMEQAMLVLIAICLITPYLHYYDLTILLAGVLILARLDQSDDPVRQALTQAALWAGWALPLILMPMNLRGMPLAPAIIAVIFIVACTIPAGRSERGISAEPTGA